MGSIRSDLVGVVFIPTDGGDILRLAAGDDIPEGVTVGDHLLAAPVVEPEPEVVPEPESVDPAPVVEPEPGEAVVPATPIKRTRNQK